MKLVSWPETSPKGDGVLATAREASGRRTGEMTLSGQEVPTAVWPGDVGGLDGGISSSSEGRKELLDSI